MSHNEAQAWWADVEHLREGIERRRASAGATGVAARPRGHEAAPTASADRARTRTSGRERRTVQITGRPEPAPAPRRLVEVQRRRPAPTAAQRLSRRPDRLAMWAVVLGFALVLVAAMSAHG
ncbi:MAG TPA: hypothetical protein VMT10_08980 [Solirubrobacteraceae bacterium]|nr:hypothetical protein [Solirubrobacteraceae bacterium]